MKSLVFAWVLLCLCSAALANEEMETDVATHGPLIWKIISLDRNASQQFGEELTLGVLYQKKYRASYRVMQQWYELIEAMPPMVPGFSRVRVVPIDVGEESILEQLLTEHEIDALYVTPVRALSIESLATTCRKLEIRTFTGVSAYTRRGIAIGFDIRGDYPRIRINLENARAEGANYHSHLLQIANLLE